MYAGTVFIFGFCCGGGGVGCFGVLFWCCVRDFLCGVWLVCICFGFLCLFFDREPNSKTHLGFFHFGSSSSIVLLS